MTELRAVREPKQRRSREAWHRVLAVGGELFVEGGVEALTISEVCRRAGVSAPSLYARVDGRAGLVAAVYEQVVQQVEESERELLSSLPGPDAPRAQRIEAVVAAASKQFGRNRDVLRAVIAASLQDEWVHRRGVEEAQRLIGGLSAALALGDEAGRDIATMLFSELVMSTMYGADFASPFAPDDEGLRNRLIRMATARAEAVGAGRS
jgi:AcrR family transcriptional regulator